MRKVNPEGVYCSTVVFKLILLQGLRVLHSGLCLPATLHLNLEHEAWKFS